MLLLEWDKYRVDASVWSVACNNTESWTPSRFNTNYTHAVYEWIEGSVTGWDARSLQWYFFSESSSSQLLTSSPLKLVLWSFCKWLLCSYDLKTYSSFDVDLRLAHLLIVPVALSQTFEVCVQRTKSGLLSKVQIYNLMFLLMWQDYETCPVSTI